MREKVYLSELAGTIAPTIRGKLMSEHSKIEWTDATWNPLRGCTKISPGCKHCYAETFAERFRGVPGHPYEQGFDLRLVPEKLSEPFQWSGPRTVFVNSMSDLFQPEVPDEYIEDVVKVMVEANWHTYQVLTKRSERLRDMLSGRLKFAAQHRHIWWGVSVEDKRYGLPRLNICARRRPPSNSFRLSRCSKIWATSTSPALIGQSSEARADEARAPCRKSGWNASSSCARDEKVAFFFKQWGGVRKANAGRRLNSRTYDEMPLPQIHSMPDKHIRASKSSAWQARSKHWARASNTHADIIGVQELAV